MAGVEAALVSAVAGVVLSEVMVKPLIAKGRKILEAKTPAEREEEVENGIQLLADQLKLLEDYLKDAEERQSTDPSVRRWLHKLEDFLYDLDDLLEDYEADVVSHKPEEISESKVRRFICCMPVKRYNSNVYANRVSAMVKLMEEIKSERESLGLKYTSAHVNNPIISSSFQRPETFSYILDEDSVFGRSELKSKIVNKLVGIDDGVESSSNNRHTVLPIVGMGGIGKTTLVKIVYNDKQVQSYFHFKIWVCVSTDFNVDSLRKKIMKRVTHPHDNKEDHNISNFDVLHEDFRKHLEGKRYLLVLDDVWNEKPILWQDLLESLLVDAECRIIVTTRTMEVANAIFNRMNPIILEGLSDDDTWKVFKHYAFRNYDLSCLTQYSQLEVIGKQMLWKFKGSPLAARSIGSLLYNCFDVNVWRDLLRNDLWRSVNDNIIPILHISYQKLNPILKRCFSLLSLFPEDFDFDRQDIISLWIAEGFVQAESEMRLEDVGRKYFDNLMSRSFFQLSPYGHDDYIMHDLIHELARSVSKETYSWTHNKNSMNQESKTIRHFSFYGNKLEITKIKNMCEHKNLRTLIFPFSEDIYSRPLLTNDVLDGWFKGLKYMRVLKFPHCKITTVPDSIGNLKHLRYLDLSHNNIEQVPTSIGFCSKLQVLNLNQCYRLKDLPDSIYDLVDLKHLIADNSCIDSLDGIGKLTSLLGLKVFKVKKRIGHRLEELKHLNLLHGELSIFDLNNVEMKEEAANIELHKKENLEKIWLRWDGREDIVEYTKEEDVLENLRPHIYLKSLRITYYHGRKSPSWLNNEDLPSLESYSLEGCCRMEVLPPLGTFPHLKRVELKDLNSLKRIDCHFYGSGVNDPFPCLEYLVLSGNDNLEEWEEICGDKYRFVKIKDITIRRCPKLTGMPPLSPNLQKRVIKMVGLTSLTVMKTNTNTGTKESSTPSHSCLPLENKPLSSMEVLVLHDCSKLAYVGMGVLGNKLTKIDLRNCPELSCDSFDDIKKGAVEVLSSLKCLCMCNCPKLVPSSLLHGGVCSSLEELEIQGFNGFDLSLTLPCLGNLSKLVSLCLDDCPNIPSINNVTASPVEMASPMVNSVLPCEEKCGEANDMLLGYLTSLKTLRLRKCPNLLECLVPPAAAGDTINKCVPIRMAALSDFELDDADIDDEWLHVFLSGQKSFPSQITYLRLSHCSNIISLPEDVLSRLTRLSVISIKHCQRLATIGLGELRALETLCIVGCPVLAAASAAPSSMHKIKVEYLKVDKCSVELLTQLLAQCSVTWGLLIKSIPELTSFDGDLEEAFLGQKALTCLTLSYCDNLLCLPAEIARLSSLRDLFINGCPKMQHLPTGLLQLTSLCYLGIWRCPELEKRISSREEGGTDWENIVHISDRESGIA